MIVEHHSGSRLFLAFRVQLGLLEQQEQVEQLAIGVPFGQHKIKVLQTQQLLM
jgi:hypothetical protein